MIWTPSCARIGSVLMLMAIGACSPLPDTGAEAGTVRKAGALAEAKLVPVDDILADADRFASDGVAVGSLEARLAALRARAAELRRR